MKIQVQVIRCQGHIKLQSVDGLNACAHPAGGAGDEMAPGGDVLREKVQVVPGYAERGHEIRGVEACQCAPDVFEI